jgi:formate dehydrogenase subunit gamma
MSKTIVRYSLEERLNHWVVAGSFLLLAISGLALFHPSLFWLSNLTGGGTWTRILHPFIGVLMALSFFGLASKLWRCNIMTDADRQWLRQMKDMLEEHEEKLPEVGRYNGGQKMLFKLMVVTVALLAVTGFVLWRPYFAPLFPVPLIRAAALLHAVSAFALIVGFIVHIYATFWVKGTLRAMLLGTVTHRWAKHHHPGWFREMTNGECSEKGCCK